MSQSILDIIAENEEQGKAVFWVLPNQLMSADVSSMIEQPVEGLLWDLNRLPETCITWIQEEKEGWVNNYAVQLVIKELYKKIERLESEINND